MTSETGASTDCGLTTRFRGPDASHNYWSERELQQYHSGSEMRFGFELASSHVRSISFRSLTPLGPYRHCGTDTSFLHFSTISRPSRYSVLDTLKLTSIDLFNPPAFRVHRVEDTEREDVVFICFQIWVLAMSLVALLNESIPHM